MSRDPDVLKNEPRDVPVDGESAPPGYRSLVVVVLSPLAFALVFACWTLFAVLGVELRRDLALGSVGFAVLLAMPMLAGALASLPMALLARRLGGRRVMLGCLLLTCPFLWWVSQAHHYLEFLLAGLGLGLGAGALAAGLVYVAELGPPRHAGLALGLYGAGMLGAGLSYLLLPLVSQAYGWRMAPLLYLLPVLLVAALLWLFADDADAPAPVGETEEDEAPPARVSPRTRVVRFACLLADWQLWRLAITYSFFFGAFVALALWLPGHLAVRYGLSLQAAALWALPFTLAVGAGQVIGGALADWRDFRSLRWWVSAFVLACLFLLSYPPFSMRIEGVHGELTLHYAAPLWGFMGLLVAMGVAMGMGQGSLMRLIHRDHGGDMALVGGLALTLGGLFAALLPPVFVLGGEWLGVGTAGFMFLYAALVACMLVMLADHARGRGRAR
ncbi:NNP family nitrate/nitrite transporter-like MFS transporter [Halomonas ventosae]|uniref:NNP family nitrate/nitrite transporter-like MFS transporter n=1 Tax=Halomonas ventosae TaxID=229007 RepID=A0A4R6ZX76_9GAMM|nr:MFS transporter [Halomonas ventosae]TDR56944.1 NNP family nitrate/nitrite transporter-like MFS transporter [Halomonas ventosae]